MKQFSSNKLQAKVAFALLFTLLCMMIFTSCKKKELEIEQDFTFELELTPVSNYIARDQTNEIKIKIVPSSIYVEAQYTIKYVQNGGQGIMRNGSQPYASNVVYELSSEQVNLSYTSRSTTNHTFDITITDNFGNERQLVFRFWTLAYM